MATRPDRRKTLKFKLLFPSSIPHIQSKYCEGGENWKIGEPQAHFLNAHQALSLAELQAQALALVNRDRQLNNLPLLKVDPLIARTAQGHAEEMAARNFYGHSNPEGQSPTDRYQALGGQGGVGENIVVLPRSRAIASYRARTLSR